MLNARWGVLAVALAALAVALAAHHFRGLRAPWDAPAGGLAPACRAGWTVRPWPAAARRQGVECVPPPRAPRPVG